MGLRAVLATVFRSHDCAPDPQLCTRTDSRTPENITVHFISVWNCVEWHWCSATVAMKKLAPAGKSSASITLHQTTETMTLMKTYVISYRAPAMLQRMSAPAVHLRPPQLQGWRNPRSESRNNPRPSRPLKKCQWMDFRFLCCGDGLKKPTGDLTLIFPAIKPIAEGLLK